MLSSGNKAWVLGTSGHDFMRVYGDIQSIAEQHMDLTGNIRQIVGVYQGTRYLIVGCIDETHERNMWVPRYTGTVCFMVGRETPDVTAALVQQICLDFKDTLCTAWVYPATSQQRIAPIWINTASHSMQTSIAHICGVGEHVKNLRVIAAKESATGTDMLVYGRIKSNKDEACSMWNSTMYGDIVVLGGKNTPNPDQRVVYDIPEVVAKAFMVQVLTETM